MERSKLKTIIILILLLMNIFLLVLVGGQHLQERQTQHTALHNAALILEQNGIVIGEEALAQLRSDALPAITAVRSTEVEAALAKALLGEDTVCTNQSGSLYVYTGSAGTALFRANGEFSVTFTLPPAAEGSCAAHADGFLAGLDLSVEQIASEEDASGSGVIAFRQMVDDVPVYTCRIFLRYTEGALTAMDGTLLTSAGAVPTGESALDASTALVRFLSGILDSGDVCSSVSSVRPGYRIVSSFSSGLSLQPVWLVSTDASEYYLDGLTGQLSRVN